MIQILNYLFGPIENGGLGISILRLPVGLLSDFMLSRNPVAYARRRDLSDFSLLPNERAFFLPILREAKKINPGLRWADSNWKLVYLYLWLVSTYLSTDFWPHHGVLQIGSRSLIRMVFMVDTLTPSKVAWTFKLFGASHFANLNRLLPEMWMYTPTIC